MCKQPEVAVEHDEIVVGDGGEHCQLIWNPTLLVTAAEALPRLSDYTGVEEQHRIRLQQGQSVMDVLAFL